ncbi:N-acetyl-gamma-glutamyl-phosphate reductase [Alteribacter natronophilus]|uniref:N-acetyl-gamma-glutamyl-phosphate reductase n=1 Tax=Alteribacter natronophilus TaxID=2583810 RepID=UPI00110E0944|nr:N-acetyl-gamma-glutamyl-phosphate reductase [Alteribacter natronophilus]TMW72495.1 N-acetyl-gamma-glutamyl-phosphate reductase [Alteribacter natronophilus]
MKAAVVGGTGYGAIELIRIIQQHPCIELVSVISKSQSGIPVEDVFPHLSEIVSYTMDVYDIQKIQKEADVVLFAAPSGVSKDLIPRCIEAGLLCVDLSGDFRLEGKEVNRRWYNQEPPPEHAASQAAYGLTELYKDEICESRIIANPGCYPTAALLGTVPVIKNGWADPSSIVIDGKSGLSGAGRGLSLNAHYSEANENVKAYKVGKHQHIPEIEQVLSREHGKDVTVSFTTHLVPMTRGLMCTVSLVLQEAVSTSQVINYYRSFYSEDPFVRVMDEGCFPSTKNVYGTNFCDIGLYADERTGRLTIVSAIDNLGKGAAGQAIQNINVLCGWDERTGLIQVPVYP